MRNHTVTFHLTYSQSTVVCATSNGLFCKRVYTPSWTMINLILHHMFQTHIIGRSHEYLGFYLFTRHTIVQYFVSTGMISIIRKHFSEYTHLRTVIVISSAISKPTFHCTCFSHNSLHKLTNGHTRGDRVGIDDQIRSNSVFGERHITFRYNHTDCTLLSRSRSHFISQIRNTFFAHAHFRNTTTFFIVSNECLVYNSQLPLLCGFGMVSEHIVFATTRDHTNHNRFVIHFGIHLNNALLI